jgi:hypothetical protein
LETPRCQLLRAPTDLFYSQYNTEEDMDEEMYEEDEGDEEDRDEEDIDDNNGGSNARSNINDFYDLGYIYGKFAIGRNSTWVVKVTCPLNNISWWLFFVF